MLRKKLFRTARLYKVQFISMILMVALGIGVFVGANAEWKSIEVDTAEFFEDSGFADYRVVDEDGITYADAKKIRDNIDGVTGVSRYLSVDADVAGSANTLALCVTESAHTSGFVLMEGEEYDRWSEDGFWLFDKYAEHNNISIGDEMTLTFEDFEFTGTVKGFIEAGEYLICVRDESQLMPDFDTYGYVFMSPTMLQSGIEQVIRDEEPDIDDDVISMAVEDVYDEIYPQVNITTSSTMSKSDFEAALEEELGRTLLVLSKDETISYAEAMGEASEGKAMAAILPALFLAIAILTLITTMNRITISEKTQIGTLKALGFRDNKITRHYTSYSVMIAILGTLLGLVFAYAFAKYVMSQNGAMGTYFVMPDWSLHAPWWTWAVVIAMDALIVFVGYLAVRKLLRGTAAETLRPYTPRHIRRVALEKTGLWSKMSFGTKWNLRDIFRHKSRSAMSFLGIFGCVLLIVAGVGMSDTANDFLDTFYNKAMSYNSKVYLSAEADNDYALELADDLDADWFASVSCNASGKAISVDVYNLEHEYFRFLNDDYEITELPEDGALICMRLAKEFDVEAGDTITIKPYGTSDSYDVKISGIFRSVTEAVSMTEDYAESIGLTDSEAYTIKNILTAEEKSDISGKYIQSIQSRQDIIDSFDAFMVLMDVFVGVMVGAAALLCLIVLYNLGVMSYMERYREMATLKVLGFRDKTIGRLLISQNLWISIVGIILGVPAGIWTLTKMMDLLASEYEMKTIITGRTYFAGIAVTLIVSIFVGFLIARRNKKIDMVEALKTEE